jgi:RNA polymerase sigma-70 factor (ECF subfamily)
MRTNPSNGAVAWIDPGADKVDAASADESRTRAPEDVAMERYAEGDDAAFEVVYDALADRISAYLRRHVRDPHRRDDLLQETFLRMHRARGTFVMGAPVLPWAFAIARRLVVDQVRRDRRTPAPVADVEPLLERPTRTAARPEEYVEARESAQRLAGALARLPDSQRIAFELLKQDGLTLVEAAAVLGTTVTAVKLRAHRAYESLRAALGAFAEVRA